MAKGNIAKQNVAKKIAEVADCEMKMAYRMIYEKMLVCYGFSYRMATTEF